MREILYFDMLYCSLICDYRLSLCSAHLEVASGNDILLLEARWILERTRIRQRMEKQHVLLANILE